MARISEKEETVRIVLDLVCPITGKAFLRSGTTSAHILYAYAEGELTESRANRVRTALDAFVEGRFWTVPDVWIVDYAADMEHDRDQQVGLNIELPDVGMERPGWFHDVEETVEFLSQLSAEIGCTFAIGMGTANGVAEDLFFVSAAPPDLFELRQILGV